MTLPGYMAVDDAHQQVFVSGSTTESTVKVIGFDGAAVDTITQEGASGLAVANGKLYVVGCGTTTIGIYDTATLTQLGTLTTSQIMRSPCDLAIAGGRAFIDQDHSGSSRAASIDLAAPHAGGELPNLSAGATFVTNPADAAQLATVSNGSSPVRTRSSTRPRLPPRRGWAVPASPPTTATTARRSRTTDRCSMSWPRTASHRSRFLI